MINTKALEIIEIVFFAISASTIIPASQIWLYRLGYNRGYGIGKHCGMTEGFYNAKQRENLRLTRERETAKMREWANSSTQASTQTAQISGSRSGSRKAAASTP